MEKMTLKLLIAKKKRQIFINFFSIKRMVFCGLAICTLSLLGWLFFRSGFIGCTHCICQGELNSFRKFNAVDKFWDESIDQNLGINVFYAIDFSAGHATIIMRPIIKGKIVEQIRAYRAVSFDYHRSFPKNEGFIDIQSVESKDPPGSELKKLLDPYHPLLHMAKNVKVQYYKLLFGTAIRLDNNLLIPCFNDLKK